MPEAFTFEFLLEKLEEQGIFNIVLPFLLIFAIVYGILEKIKLFQNKSINGIVAFVIGSYITMFSPFAPFLMNIVGTGSVVVIGLLFFAIIVGFIITIRGIGEQRGTTKSRWRSPIVTIGGLIAVIIFLNAGGADTILRTTGISIGPETIFGAVLIYVIYIGIKKFFGEDRLDPDEIRELVAEAHALHKEIEKIPEPEIGPNDERVIRIREIKEEVTKSGVPSEWFDAALDKSTEDIWKEPINFLYAYGHGGDRSRYPTQGYPPYSEAALQEQRKRRREQLGY